MREFAAFVLITGALQGGIFVGDAAAKPSRAKPARVEALQVPDESLEAVRDKSAAFEMAGGDAVIGELLSFDATNFTLAELDGTVRTLPRAALQGVKLRPAAEEPAPVAPVAEDPAKLSLADLEAKYGMNYSEGRGTGRVITGRVMLGLSIPQMIGGIIACVLADDNDLVLISGSALIGVGAAHFITGIGLVVSGSAARSRYQRWLHSQPVARISPQIHRVGQHWTFGVRFAF